MHMDRRPSIFSVLLVAVLLAVFGGAERASAQGCMGDLNGDGKVDGADLATVLSNWGPCPATVVSVSPLQGSVLGGTVITVNGTGLAATQAVTVGGVPCTALQVLSPTQVRATTPAGSVGPAAIAITTATGSTLAPQPFNYVQQSVSSIVPSSGGYQGGTAITITGAYLAGTTSVTIGGVPATAVQAVNATTVTAVTPAGSVGAVDVVVSGIKGSVTIVGGFTYSSSVVPAWATLIEAQPDPSVVTDATLRAAIVATSLAWRVKDTATQIEFVLIPPGTFNMGCSASQQYGCWSDENPVHQVTLTNAFYLGRYEVTQAQWQARMGSNPSWFPSASAQVPLAQVPQRPVETVSWITIQGFLSQTGMRLPTEAEWEYAYRAGTTTAFHGYTGQLSGTNDDNLLGNIAWFNGNSNSQTRPVGGKLGNGFGLHDMSGNVWEWVNDWYGDYSAGAQTNPQGPSSGSYRVLRGGFWSFDSISCRASDRSGDDPGYSSIVIGFRVARTP